MKRGIFFRNNSHNPSHYDKEVIMKQYELAVDLYKHEDGLNWTKISQLFYINAGLLGIASFLIGFIDNINTLFYSSLAVVSVLGILSTLMFQITINNGISYMQRRKAAVVEIESILSKLGGLEVVKVNFNKSDRRFKRSPTATVMYLIPWGIALIWCGVFITSLCFLFL